MAAPLNHDPAALRNHEITALVAKAQAGDTAAFERLIAMYHGKVVTFAFAFTKDREAASDLAQEALIKVYRSIGNFRFQSSLTTWLFRVVKNTFLDHAKSRHSNEQRSTGRIDDIHERDLREASHGAEAQLLQREEHDALWAALRDVPETYRTVLVLADMQGMSYEEVAVITDAPLGTVKSRLKRGRDKLREILISRRPEAQQPAKRTERGE